MLLALSLSLASLPVITLERTTCFGTCPAYKVSIFGDGLVLFEGKEFVKTKGDADGRITKDELQQLVREFEKIDYLKLYDRYGDDEKTCPESWTDYPSAITSLNSNGKQKTVHHYLGCRGLTILDQLTALENKIDEVVNTKRWIK
jgi:cellulose synthase/poly-beta-1,6-N-acetylglucosamine synthase-like glycosyltransferase